MVPLQENSTQNINQKICWKRSRVLQQHPGVGGVNSGFTLRTTTTTDAKVGSLPRTFWSHQKKCSHFVLVGRESTRALEKDGRFCGVARFCLFFLFCFLALKVSVVVFDSLLAALNATQGRCFFLEILVGVRIFW